MKFLAIRQLGWMIYKEFNQMWANRSAMVIIVAMPVIQLLVLPFAVNFEVRKVRLGIRDYDHSSGSRALLEKFCHHDYFQTVILNPGTSLGSLPDPVTVDAVLNIPRHFGREVLQGGPVSIFTSIDAVDAVKASIISGYLNEMISQFAVQYSAHMSTRTSSDTQINTRIWYNPQKDYKLFIVPGIIAFLVTMVGIYLIAMSVVREKQSGTARQLQMVPLRIHTILLGKLLSIWLVCMLIFVLGILISGLVYGIRIKGDFSLLLLFTGWYLIPVLLLGLILASYCENQFQSMLLSFFFVLIFILTGGLFSPISSMPTAIQALANSNPVHLLIEVMRMVVLKGGTVKEATPYFLSCMYQVMVLLLICFIRYLKS